jgi:RHS repeat-associated protein
VVTRITAATNRFITTGSTPTTYDAAGNITQDTKFRNASYAYYANGRQTAATLGGLTQNSVYDCAGQRVQTSTTAKGTPTRTMVYDIFGQDIADYSGSTGSTLERKNIYRGGQLLATYEAGSSALKYVLTDIQGSTRAIMNNSGGSSSVIARHDYLPFGEEIAAGVGLRTGGLGYGATDTNRWKYGLTERDDTTGLDHTWWRKYESFSGRWTSPDPYTGSMSIGDPQSFNRYAFVQNDPVNFADPSGLHWEVQDCHENLVWISGDFRNGGYYENEGEICDLVWVNDGPLDSGSRPDPGNIPSPQSDNQEHCDALRKLINDIINRVKGPEGGLKGLRYRYIEQVNGKYGPGTRKWETHEREFTKQQRKLREVLDDWNMSNCGPPPPGARKWATKSAPSPKQWINAHRPAPQASYSIPWQHIQAGVGTTLW